MALNTGDVAPDFEFTDRDGILKKFSEMNGMRIVFFFPQAFTPGCTAQACSMQENYDNLKKEGVDEVYAISIDTSEKLQKFKDKYKLDYLMVPDQDGSISKSYDVYNNLLFKKISGRVTYTVDNEGIITNVIDSGVTGKKTEHSLSEHGLDLLNLLQK